MEQWKKYQLKDVTTLLGDGLHGTPKYDKNGTVFFINGNNLVDGKIEIKDSTKRVSEDEANKYRKNLNHRTILVSINGTIGNVAKYQGEACILGKSACYFNVAEDFDLNFIYYVVASQQFKNSIMHLATGTTIKNVSLETMRNYSFVAPSINEQKRISSLLSSLDNKIDLNRRINDNLEQQAQALFKSWFVDFEPFKDGKFVESELGMIPKGWRVGTLNEIGNVVGGGTPSKSKPEYYCSDGIAWITPKDLSILKAKFIFNGEIDITELGYKNSSAKIMPKGSILFSSRAPIGYIAIAQNDITTNQGFKSVIPKKAGTAFIYLYLKENVDNIESQATGSTFKEASGSLMKAQKVVIPSGHIYDDFENLLQPIFKKQANLEIECRNLSTIRNTLLPKLMSGKLKINNLTR